MSTYLKKTDTGLRPIGKPEKEIGKELRTCNTQFFHCYINVQQILLSKDENFLPFEQFLSNITQSLNIFFKPLYEQTLTRQHTVHVAKMSPVEIHCVLNLPFPLSPLTFFFFLVELNQRNKKFDLIILLKLVLELIMSSC